MGAGSRSRGVEKVVAAETSLVRMSG